MDFVLPIKAIGEFLHYLFFQRGIVHSDDQNYFVIHPLPKRFHNETSNPHLLIRKSHTAESSSSCPHSHLIKTNLSKALLRSLGNNITSQQTKDFRVDKTTAEKQNVLRRRKRETFPEGAPAFVETAVFVDRDLFDHMKSNFPVDTERELIRFVLAMINAVSCCSVWWR